MHLAVHTENHADGPTTWWTLLLPPNPTTSRDAPIEHAILRAGERVAVIPEYLYMYGCWWSLHTFAIRRGERLEELRRRLRREREVRVAAGPFEFDVNPGGRT